MRLLRRGLELELRLVGSGGVDACCVCVCGLEVFGVVVGGKGSRRLWVMGGRKTHMHAYTHPSWA